MDKVKKKNIIIIVVASLIVVASAVTYAFVYSRVGGTAETDVDVASGEEERLTFIEGEPLYIESSIENFSSEHGSLSATTKPKVKYVTDVEGVETTNNYDVYLVIEENGYIYTTAEQKPELVLTIIDPTGNRVTNIDGLNPVTTIDYKTNTEISGFDITTFNDAINITQQYPISTNSVNTGEVHEWEFIINYINLDSVQSENEGKILNAKIVMGDFNCNNDYDISQRSSDSVYVKNYIYTGSTQELNITTPGQYLLQTWGAEGGYATSETFGGDGGYSEGVLNITSDTNLYINVGNKGSKLTGGYNGGGSAIDDTYDSYGGGGASDIRITTNSLYSRVIVAGGGGGANGTRSNTSTRAGGFGGGLVGGTATQYSSYTPAGGGTQTAGGARGYLNNSYYGIAGTFGNGANGTSNYSTSGGGGGGGWYGGGSGHPGSTTTSIGGGGGSGYVYTEETAISYPSGVLLDSTHYLTQANTFAGNTNFVSPTGTIENGHNGTGYARVTAMCFY